MDDLYLTYLLTYSDSQIINYSAIHIGLSKEQPEMNIH